MNKNKETRIKHMTLSQIETELRGGILYKAWALFNKRAANEYAIKYMMNLGSIAAVAQPMRNRVVIIDDVYDKFSKYEAVAKNIIAHEQGHITDYKNRGPIRFYMEVLLEVKKKTAVTNELAIARYYGNNEDLVNVLEKYYSLPLEKAANDYAGLTYRDFYIEPIVLGGEDVELNS